MAVVRPFRRLNRYRVARAVRLALLHVVAVGAGITFVIPFVWMLSTSLKTPQAVFRFPPEWIPNPVVWRNYVNALTMVPFGVYSRNTAIITAASLAGQILSASVVAYGFARLRFPGRDVLFILLLATMMLPWQVTMVPLFVVFKNLHWLNTYLPLVLPKWLGGDPFFIFLLRQFFLTLPQELDEAAKIDGCGPFRIYWQILLPLAVPGLTAVAIFSFLWNWNDFLWPLIILNDRMKWTIALGLSGFRDEYSTNWSHLMAASAVATLPCLLVFFFFQRYFIEGIVMTGTKG